MKKRFLTAISVLLCLGFGAKAQNVVDLIISEVMAESDSLSLVDDFGRRNGWIEVFNTSQGTVNLAGCYLTDDRNNLRKSVIPKGDLRTQLGPRQSFVFFASGNGSDGTFYTGFEISGGSTIYLVSNDGRTIVDSLAVPAGLPAGKSVTKAASDLKQMDFQPMEEPVTPTPYAIYGSQSTASKAQVMAEQDPRGLTLSVTSVSVVFAALAILWFLFWLLFERPARQAASKASKPKEVKPAKKTKKTDKESEVAAAIGLALDMESNGDVYAAIATALHLYLSDCVHDSEPYVITIRRSGASGWNDKSQNFRKSPKK